MCLTPFPFIYNPQRFKLLFLDIGLIQRACDLNISRWITE